MPTPRSNMDGLRFSEVLRDLQLTKFAKIFFAKYTKISSFGKFAKISFHEIIEIYRANNSHQIVFAKILYDQGTIPFHSLCGNPLPLSWKTTPAKKPLIVNNFGSRKSLPPSSNLMAAFELSLVVGNCFVVVGWGSFNRFENIAVKV